MHTDLPLIRLLAVAGVDALDDVHPGNDLSKWSEAHRVQAAIVAEIDEKLCGSRIRRRALRKSHRANEIALLHWLVSNVRILPRFIHRRIAGKPELDNETRQNAEERRAVKETVLDEIIETVRAQGCQRPRHLNYKIALSGFESGLIRFGSVRFQFGRMQKCWIDRHAMCCWMMNCRGMCRGLRVRRWRLRG